MSTHAPKTAAITFTSDEARVTLELIDVAIKTLGIKGAEAGVVLFKKINSAFEPPKENNVLQQLPPVGE